MILLTLAVVLAALHFYFEWEHDEPGGIVRVGAVTTSVLFTLFLTYLIITI